VNTLPRHPRGIYTLYFTEVWERMSYYGMRAILILYMVSEQVKGGMGLDESTAGAIYGLYTCAVYLVALPGGWIADRLIGPQRAVLFGGIIIALGHFTLAIPNPHTFFAGLLIVVLGTSLLKPNASALVGQLYPEGGARRDAGFTLFYMGVNLGGLIGPLVCGYFGEHVNWHYGFAAAGVGMVLGVIQYIRTRHHLGTAGLHPPAPTKTPRRDWTMVAVGLAAILIVAALALTGWLVINPLLLAKRTSIVIVTAAGLWFAWAFLLGRLDRVEKKRLLVVVILFFASALFWSGFEQAGSVMNLFSERYTDRVVFNRELPASWFQTINPLLILVLAVPVSLLWLGLAKRSILPSLATKFAAGLLLLAAGFLVMHFAARHALSVGKVTGLWLVTTYLLQTLGELFVSPVGLSAVTKLAPARLASQTMGVWFLSVSLGNLIAGMFAGGMSAANAAGMPAQFLHVALFAGGAGLVLFLFSPLIRRLMPGIQ
jgi:POT family proton-dependent oligopeptide transporter